MLDDRVAAAQRGRGRQGQQPGPGVRKIVTPAGQAGGQRQPGPLHQRVDPFALALHLPHRVGQGRAGPDRLQPGRLPVQPAGHDPPGPVAQLADERELLADVGHHPLGRVGRGGRAQVGDVIQQRRVLFVADRAHHRGPAGRDRPDQGLVGERQQVLQRPAAPGDHDDVHLGIRVQPPQRVGHLLGRERPLHRRLLDPEPDGRPAPGRVLQHVALGRRVAPADEADDTRQEGESPFSFGRKKTFRAELAAQPFQPGQQLADAHRADLERGQGE